MWTHVSPSSFVHSFAGLISWMDRWFRFPSPLDPMGTVDADRHKGRSDKKIQVLAVPIDSNNNNQLGIGVSCARERRAGSGG